jgi:Domain of unknown function (DUF4145)
MNLTFYGAKPAASITSLRLGGVCPNCKTGSRFTLEISPREDVLSNDRVNQFVASYACDNCLAPIPIKWTIQSWQNHSPVVHTPEVLILSREPFDFEYIPKSVTKEIEEALNCLSVNAWNGFAAVCRRAVQAICVDLGAGASTRVQNQIEEMITMTALGDIWKELAIEIMLAGHDGSHPHLPDVTSERASVLLGLLKDLTYQLYTRPGKIKESAQLRQGAIQAKKTGAP